MKFSSIIFTTLITLLFSGMFISCSSLLGSDEEELKAGTFKATATGTIENEFSGAATFSISEVENRQQELLSLNLKVGHVPFIPDLDTGIFLVAPWDSLKNSLSIDKFIISSYVDPDTYQQLYIDSGTINLEKRDENRLSGTFNLNMSDNQRNIEVTGTFKADKR